MYISVYFMIRRASLYACARRLIPRRASYRKVSLGDEYWRRIIQPANRPEQIRDKMVRSTLLQVRQPGAPSGVHPGVLLFVGLGTVCHMIIFDQVRKIKNSPCVPESFSMFFRLVKVSYPCDNGNHCPWSQFSQNH